jgi:hypothetical protein
MAAYLGVASENGLAHKVGEVEGVADQRAPAEQVGQAQPPGTASILILRAFCHTWNTKL